VQFAWEPQTLSKCNFIGSRVFFFFHVQEALKRKLKARMEYAKFLQDTAKEMAKEVQTSRSGETKQTAEDLDEFLNKV
jgi:hypothetical protein